MRGFQAASSDEETSQMELMQSEGRGRYFSTKVVAAVSVGAALLLAPAAYHYSSAPQAAAVDMVTADYMIEADPKMQDCADTTNNCMTNKCCKTSGFKCWRITDTVGKCSKFCPGGNCWVEKPWFTFKPAVMARDNSIFCYTVYAANKGKSLENKNDLNILQTQLKNGVGMFACNDWEVFSDKVVQLSPTIQTTVLPANAEYGKFFRKDKPDHYINTPLFMEAWRKLKADGRWSAMSWVVKVDAPTVFMPDNLRSTLASKMDTPTGVYFQNCQGVLEGFFGNLEVSSAEGFKRFLEQFEKSFTDSCWRQETPVCKKEWKYGPWGEDLFMQRTMDDAEVAKISDFALTKSGTCPKDRPKDERKNKLWVPPCTAGETKAALHPFRTVSEWFKCMGTITGKKYAAY
mmetsp:Transcript_36197/g.81776  ORF Transcript_36197/g.81776 Transcript_36197/m.81776 type:complete len:403 (-) Transcript_36197:166-1374(-)